MSRTVLFYVFIYIFFNSLHVSSTSCSSSGETNCVNTSSGNCHSVSVAVSCAGRKFTSDLHTTQSDSYQVVLPQFVSPDDEHDVIETCRELKNRNKYIRGLEL